MLRCLRKIALPAPILACGKKCGNFQRQANLFDAAYSGHQLCGIIINISCHRMIEAILLFDGFFYAMKKAACSACLGNQQLESVRNGCGGNFPACCG
jgi:hypothetical protein